MTRLPGTPMHVCLQINTLVSWSNASILLSQVNCQRLTSSVYFEGERWDVNGSFAPEGFAGWYWPVARLSPRTNNPMSSGSTPVGHVPFTKRFLPFGLWRGSKLRLAQGAREVCYLFLPQAHKALDTPAAGHSRGRSMWRKWSVAHQSIIARWSASLFFDAFDSVLAVPFLPNSFHLVLWEHGWGLRNEPEADIRGALKNSSWLMNVIDEANIIHFSL
jgi:hypothetical protein